MKNLSDETRTNRGRRELLLTAATAALASGTVRAQAPVETQTSNKIPINAPQTEFVYEAIVEIEPTIDLGIGPLGQRRMVPITGGTFEGPHIKGRVMPGGADRQLLRADGFLLLDALYELETDDSAIITVRNKVTIPPQSAGRRPLSALEITAPTGPYNWLNQSIYVGTLNTLRPERQAVVIRVFRLI